MMYQARNTKNKHNCITLLSSNREFIIFDTETTGKDPEKDYIVELAAKKYRMVDKKPQLVETMDLYMRPPFYMDKKVVDIHHITNEFLEDKEPESVVFPDIDRFFGPHPILLAYNADFDIGMLNSLYNRNGSELQAEFVLDVMEMGYDLIQGNDVKDHKLGTLVSLLGLDKDLTFHNALDDTEATFRLMMYCYQEYKNQPDNRLKQRIYVNAIYFWKGFKKEQSGVYLKTSLGNVYFSTYLKMWRSSAVDLTTVDIDAMEEHVLKRMGITLKELGKMTERKFELLKVTCRERGVYL